MQLSGLCQHGMLLDERDKWEERGSCHSAPYRIRSSTRGELVVVVIEA